MSQSQKEQFSRFKTRTRNGRIPATWLHPYLLEIYNDHPNTSRVEESWDSVSIDTLCLLLSADTILNDELNKDFHTNIRAVKKDREFKSEENTEDDMIHDHINDTSYPR